MGPARLAGLCSRSGPLPLRRARASAHTFLDRQHRLHALPYPAQGGVAFSRPGEQVTTERLPEFAAALQSFCIHLILTSAGQATSGCVDAELTCAQRSVSSPIDAVAGRRPGTGCESRWMHCCRWRSETTASKF